MNDNLRAWSTLTTKSIDQEQRLLEGWASRPEVDRVGDIVEPMGCSFSIPMPLLWQHDHTSPVGSVVAANATKEGISIRARIVKIAEPGKLKELADMAYQAVKYGLVKGLSIGFRPVEVHPMPDTGGMRFLKTSVYELSLVTVPACQSATITAIKSFDTGLPAASGKTLPGVVLFRQPEHNEFLVLRWASMNGYAISSMLPTGTTDQGSRVFDYTLTSI